MVKTCEDFIGEQCIRNNDGMLAVRDEDKKKTQKIYHGKLLNADFIQYRHSLSQVNRFRGVLHLIQKDIVIELISKIRNRKPAGLSNLVSEMVKAAEEAEVDMITDLVNQIIREEAIPAEWELSTVVKYYKEKENALEGRNCKGAEMNTYYSEGYCKVDDTTGGHQ